MPVEVVTGLLVVVINYRPFEAVVEFIKIDIFLGQEIIVSFKFTKIKLGV